MSTYLFCLLVYRNWQRPGAAISLTIEEAAGAVEKDRHLVLHSRHHKTTLTHGSAIMVIHQEDTALFLHYRDVMRPNVAGSSAGTSNILLINSHCRPLTSYRNAIKSLTWKFKPPPLSTAMAVWKAGATKIVGSDPS